MNSFKSALDDLELKELKPHGRQFTWSSETVNPTFTKIDHIFVTKDWELVRLAAFVHALFTSASDHCRLLLVKLPDQQCRRFRFETFWTKLPGFRETMQASWERPFSSDDKIRVLHVKLSRLAKALRRWSCQQLRPLKFLSDIATTIVQLLDQAQEQRFLTPAELDLRRKAKARILGFTALRRIKIRQRSRLTWIRLGDANTKFFHLRANARGRKNFIPQLSAQGSLVTSHQDKEDELYRHFSTILGQHTQRESQLNLDSLNITSHDLHDLDAPFLEEELKTSVMQTPKEKAPGPDGYTGLFYKICRDIIKVDLLAALQ
jgi:hypothetical protein